MVDMATRYDEYPPEDSDFSMMRDSLYILCIMNQYTPKHSLPPIEAERLLRLALFSKMLPLNGSEDGQEEAHRACSKLSRGTQEGCHTSLYILPMVCFRASIIHPISV